MSVPASASGAPVPVLMLPAASPHPLSLARNHAEAERIRLADSAAYSAMCATWGSLGGLTTFYRYGADYYRLLAARRWYGEAGVTAGDLEEYRTTAKARRS